MKKYIHTGIYSILARTLSIFLAAIYGISIANAIPLEQYSAESQLAQGRWRKIIVPKTGMQFISNAQLRTMGFTDPAKVNVYGYGGREITTILSSSTYVDDLPMQPVVRTADGLIFYGVAVDKWSIAGDYYVPYKASLNMYSTQSVYFISDRENTTEQMPEQSTPLRTEVIIVDSFRERILHEKDLAAPSNAGGWILGEDFTQQRHQDFKFSLPGLVPQSEVGVSVSFGVNSLTNSSLQISINGEEMPATASDILTSNGSAETFLTPTTTVKVWKNPTEEMTVGVQYNATGQVLFARLAQIIVSYDRQLDITDGPITFYTSNNYNSTTTYKINGCGGETQIWDVTDPSRPVRIKYTLKDGKAMFTSATSAYREYVAFNPDKITLTPTIGEYIQNQNLHARSVPDMVIISPKQYTSQAERIADMHRHLDAMDVLIVTPEELYNEFSSGAPDVTAYRKALKMWYDRGMGQGGADFASKLKYCLIMGRPTYDQRQLTDIVRNAGYPRPLIWQTPDNSMNTYSQTTAISSDDYITCLEDNQGRFELRSAKMSISVGRMPVRYADDARRAVDKLLKYIEQPELGSWRNRIVMIADNGEDEAMSHYLQSESMYKIMQSGSVAPSFNFDRIYFDTYTPKKTSTGVEYPVAKQRFLHALEEGTGIVTYIGHANPREWTHDNFFNYTDITSMNNKRLPFFYTATCEFTRWDADELSGGELMWNNDNGGAIALISTSRSVFISYNGILTNNVARYFLSNETDGKARRIGDILRLAKNHMINDDNRLSFLTIGDPAMRMPIPQNTVRVEAINGQQIDPDNPDTWPTLQGGEKMTVSGSILNTQGNVATGFNGNISIDVYDAERTYETMPDSYTDTVYYYNDRQDLIAIGKTTVSAGRWNAEIYIPTDIANLFTPAQLSLYAWDETGAEAHSTCQSMYIYGLSETTDDKGPQITEFTLNTPAFVSGQQVGPHPVVYASFTDESGINISNVGIGHQMNLCIDGKTYYTDLINYYTPKQNDPYSGSVIYPIQDLEPGKHTLTLTVCDNANNISTADIDFVVTASPKPNLYRVSTDVNPAVSSVKFILAHDRLSQDVECTVDVYNLNGMRVWSGRTSGKTDLEKGPIIEWNLCDGSGTRVPRGIYLYRATVKTAEGVSVSQTQKLAVAAAR